MNRRKTFFSLILIIAMLLGITAAAAASGNAEAGQPEPVEVKSDNPPEPASPSGTGYPPEGWVTDITEAYRLAQDGDKNILINFTGSDWCGWCKKLSEEVFSTKEFRTYSDESLVLLYLDFPQAIELSADQTRHNQIMAQMLGVQGYPTIWLLGSDLTPLLSTGYRNGGAEAYIEHLKNDRPEISPEESVNFREGFTRAIETNIGSLN